jgi:hypothetical protein
MKVTRKVGEDLTFEFEAQSPKDVFCRLALLDSLFTESTCGVCGSARIRFVRRDIDNGFYLEQRCQEPNCGAQLSFGQNKEGGGIYVKNWDKDNKRPMPNRGWYIYKKNEQGDQEEPRRETRRETGPSEDIPFSWAGIAALLLPLLGGFLA